VRKIRIKVEGSRKKNAEEKLRVKKIRIKDTEERLRLRDAHN